MPPVGVAAGAAVNGRETFMEVPVGGGVLDAPQRGAKTKIPPPGGGGKIFSKNHGAIVMVLFSGAVAVATVPYSLVEPVYVIDFPPSK